MNKEEIKHKAEECIRKYNPNHLAPFPYSNIVNDNEQNLIVSYANLRNDISGLTMFIVPQQKFGILINKNKPENRQNFTLAHELGHFFLHQSFLKNNTGIIDHDDEFESTKMLFRSDYANREQLEIEANQFAAFLLMPDDLVRDAWRVTLNIEECAKMFRVSSVAMSIKLTSLGVING